MENNKILIEVEFYYKNSNTNKGQSYCIELFVLRDIKLKQLLEGIQYGLEKMARADGKYQKIYARCFDILEKCHHSTKTTSDGRTYYNLITFTSYNDMLAQSAAHGGNRYVFFKTDLSKRICDLGFITSSKIVFDETGTFMPAGSLETKFIIDAFNPKKARDIYFPEYNISNRQIYQFDETPVDIISPTEPPQKPEESLLSLLLPTMITLFIMVAVRGVASSMLGGGLIMVAMTAAMSISAIITTILSFRKQKKKYAADKTEWMGRYQDYIDDLIAQIKTRQHNDVRTMNWLYPDVFTLVSQNDVGVYSLNNHLYSRVPQDEDFLSFKLGLSNDVPNKFEIKGESEKKIFSVADAAILKDNAGTDRLHIYLKTDEEEEEKKKAKQQKKNKKQKQPVQPPADPKPKYTVNLTEIPGVISRRYKNMKNAPLMYSLKNKGALGLVDININEMYSKGNYFIKRMIFELCYYHSPETLQFVIFFPYQRNLLEMEKYLAGIKCMPHFRGLFDDKSQFVFNSESANMVMSSMLTLMNHRAYSENADVQHPHIVFIVFEEFGLKEHAFAEFLPKAPEQGEDFVNSLGLTFIFAKKYKEYLPEYCDDVIDLNESPMKLMPRRNQLEAQEFVYSEYFNKSASEIESLTRQFYVNKILADRFMSAIYYAKIAENGKVPSKVSMYDLFPDQKPSTIEFIENNWGFGASHTRADITETLATPIGLTETEIIDLDLHEKADGPHMLVAGTTGSGKTETVISFLLGLCMKYRPDELNLLLVDMKGGGFTKRIGSLPHVVGSVTDVDGDENGTGAEYMLRRFLNAMSSEIKRRKILFNKMKVDSIDAYIDACRDIKTHIEKKQIPQAEVNEVISIARNKPLSHLILVVDEFTELKRFTTENNDIDFMGEITTLARVGRSLGFHIILISQNIEGAITDDIRVNSKSRLCLKVATKQASKDMLGTDVAAAPSMPGNGRAYLLVGTGSKFEYFQSGYSGASSIEDAPIDITLASKTGGYSRFYRSTKDNKKLIEQIDKLNKSGELKTQLEEIVTNIDLCFRKNEKQINPPHIIFRSPLPRNIIYDEATHKPVEIEAKDGAGA